MKFISIPNQSRQPTRVGRFCSNHTLLAGVAALYVTGKYAHRKNHHGSSSAIRAYLPFCYGGGSRHCCFAVMAALDSVRGRWRAVHSTESESDKWDAFLSFDACWIYPDAISRAVWLSCARRSDGEFLRLRDRDAYFCQALCWIDVLRLTGRPSQSPLALSVPLSRFTPRLGGGSAFYVSSMSQTFTESHRHLLIVLFWLFELLLVAAVATIFCIDSRRWSPVQDAAGLTFWFAFIGLFTVSFVLRRTCRRLAIIGWFSLFLGFWSLALLPVF
jgi:hypothetical protein